MRFARLKNTLCFKGTVALSLFMVFCAACGARLKTADQVESIFGKTKDLGTKVNDLCSILSTRTAEPTLQNVGLSSEACQQAGLQAQDLKLTEDLGFAAIREDGQKYSTTGGGIDKQDQELRLQTRTEVWLNRSLLGAIQTLLPLLKDKGDGVAGSGGTASDTAQKFTVKLIGKPDFDAQNYQLKLKFELTSRREQNGQVDVFNTFEVNALLLNKQFGAGTVQTIEDSPVEKSIIKRGKLLVFLVPHAGDIYMDIITDLTLHSFGVDSVMKQQFLKVISDALKTIPKFIDEAQAKANK